MILIPGRMNTDYNIGRPLVHDTKSVLQSYLKIWVAHELSIGALTSFLRLVATLTTILDEDCCRLYEFSLQTNNGRTSIDPLRV